MHTGGAWGEEQGYVTIDANEVTLPYLPDPFCNGALIRLQFSSSEPEQRFEIVFEQVGDWYQLIPFRLRLEEGSHPPAQYDAQQRLFTVRLPKGRVAQMRLNSLFLNDGDLFEIMSWCRDRLAPTAADRVFQAINESRHWMTTPWRTIQLVHAVQQPLEDPSLEFEAIEDGSFKRQIGETDAELTGRVELDGGSTASLDLVAEWDEPIDDPDLVLLDVENMIRHVRSNVLKITLPEPFGTPWATEIRPFLEIADAFDEQEWRTLIFSSKRADEFENMGPEEARTELLRRSAGSSLSVQERARIAAAAVQLEGLRSHEFGDTKYRRVGYQMVAATRFREYFDPNMPVEDGLRKGNVVTIDILSSAPPVAPLVLEVVPIVRWKREGIASDGHYDSIRHSAGLRVWLARPWFTSGAGEMLGVVCDEGGGPITPTDLLYHQLTVISQDPIHATVMPIPLRVESFPNTDRVARGIRLPFGNMTCDIAAFRPRYNQVRNAWYCDVAFETSESYFPFVRLGLVRFQPKSLERCQMSSIVPTTFLQPMPERSLTVIRLDEHNVSITLRGPAPRGNRAADGGLGVQTNTVTVVVEAQDPNTSDPALGWVPVDDEILLKDSQILLDPLLDGATRTEWSGEVHLPAATGRPLRLAVREYEIHSSDDRRNGIPVLVQGRRLVHADVIPIG